MRKYLIEITEFKWFYSRSIARITLFRKSARFVSEFGFSLFASRILSVLASYIQSHAIKKIMSTFSTVPLSLFNAL
jgi:hypothetical protein